MTQRFAIGGLVTAFAIRARAVHGLSDAHVGVCFSLLLVVFAATVFTLGRKRSGRALAACLPAGAALFGASFAALSVVPRPFLPLALAGAGFGAALVYAPCLDLVSAAAPGGRRATAMALLHSAGAVGMILGPVCAALLEVVLGGWSAPQRGAAFMTFAGVLHATVTIGLSSRCRAIAASSSATVTTTNE
jgi:MFS family permease